MTGFRTRPIFELVRRPYPPPRVGPSQPARAEYLVPGDSVRVSDLDESELYQLQNELELQDMVLSRRGRVGTLASCGDCDGCGLDDRGRDCEDCDGSGRMVDFGDGIEPWHG